MSKYPYPDTNPFLDELKVEVGHIVDSVKIVGYYSGQYRGEGTRVDVVESVKHTRVYQEDMMLKVLTNFSSVGKSLYLYIIYKLTQDSDTIELMSSRVTTLASIHRNSMPKAIEELENAGLLRRKSKFVYWVNPRYLFNGNRIKYMVDSGVEHKISVAWTKNKDKSKHGE